MADATATGPPSSRRALLADVVALTKPGITALICLVAVGGFLLAAPGAVAFGRLGLLVATGAAASAGSAMLNHYLDRDLDARMRRTQHRPLPEARIAPSGVVAAGGIALLAGGVAAASLLLNPLTGLSILLGGLTYVVVYTAWLKRRSSWNIVIGGFAGSAPALAGGAAALGTWSPAVIAFALLVFLWTPPHFWSLALLLKDDYARAGLPMLPRMDDAAYSARVVVVSAGLLVPATLAIGLTGALAWPVLAVLLALGAGFVLVTSPLWHGASRAVARRGFLYSGPYLLGVVVAIVANAPLLRLGLGPAF
ncbi:MAG TPA: heme o synthase [Thermoplasmata archaeon]|nr:heme o synthase [Thermoplasmata archaeon]